MFAQWEVGIPSNHCTKAKVKINDDDDDDGNYVRDYHTNNILIKLWFIIINEINTTILSSPEKFVGSLVFYIWLPILSQPWDGEGLYNTRRQEKLYTIL